jgi:hypothetical protein
VAVDGGWLARYLPRYQRKMEPCFGRVFLWLNNNCPYDETEIVHMVYLFLR